LDFDLESFLVVLAALPVFLVVALLLAFLPLDLSADLLEDLAFLSFDSFVFFSSFLGLIFDSFVSLVLGFLAASAFYLAL